MTPAGRTTTRPEARAGATRRKSAADARPRELDHRVANSLQLAVDFLLFEQARVADPVARRALIDTAERLVAVGHLHRFLCAHDDAAEDASVDLKLYFEELAAILGQSTGLDCRAEVEALAVSPSMAQRLGLAVNELATNAAKHAYAPGEPGKLLIQAWRERGRLFVSVADYGDGLGGGFDLEQGHGGLGMTVVRAIARELSARLEAEDDGGARFTLSVPLPRPETPAGRSFDPPDR